jgi:signal peptidase I
VTQASRQAADGDPAPDTKRTASAEPTSGTARTRQPSLFSTVRETLVVVVIALIVASLLRAFVVQAFVVPSASMENTLIGGGGATNDRIAVDKLPGRTIRRGEIVVFPDPGGWLDSEPSTVRTGVAGDVSAVLSFVGLLPDTSTGHLVKRVIGVGGDTVSCAGVGSPLRVDGVALSEASYLFPGSDPCADTSTGEHAWSYTVPAGDLFVMGDNRDNSADSRWHPADPFVPVSSVTGRVWAVVYPFDRLSREPIPATFASIPAPSAQHS